MSNERLPVEVPAESGNPSSEYREAIRQWCECGHHAAEHVTCGCYGAGTECDCEGFEYPVPEPVEVATSWAQLTDDGRHLYRVWAERIARTQAADETELDAAHAQLRAQAEELQTNREGWERALELGEQAHRDGNLARAAVAVMELENDALRADRDRLSAGLRAMARRSVTNRRSYTDSARRTLVARAELKAHRELAEEGWGRPSVRVMEENVQLRADLASSRQTRQELADQLRIALSDSFDRAGEIARLYVQVERLTAQLHSQRADTPPAPEGQCQHNHPSQSCRLCAGIDGTVSVSTDHGKTWSVPESVKVEDGTFTAPVPSTPDLERVLRDLVHLHDAAAAEASWVNAWDAAWGEARALLGELG
jgi:hypothetical protein